MINLNEFKDHSQYENFNIDQNRPSVSLCINQKEVHYDPAFPTITGKITVPSTVYEYEQIGYSNRDYNYDFLYSKKYFLEYETGDRASVHDYNYYVFDNQLDENDKGVKHEEAIIDVLLIDPDTNKILNYNYEPYYYPEFSGETAYYSIPVPIVKITHKDGRVEYEIKTEIWSSNLEGNDRTIHLDSNVLPAFEKREVVIGSYSSGVRRGTLYCIYVTQNDEIVNESECDANFTVDASPRIITTELYRCEDLLKILINGNEVNIEEVMNNGGFIELDYGKYDITYAFKPFTTALPYGIIHDIPLEKMKVSKYFTDIESNFSNMPLLGTDEETIRRIFPNYNFIEAVFENEDFSDSEFMFRSYNIHEGEVGVVLSI